MGPHSSHASRAARIGRKLGLLVLSTAVALAAAELAARVLLPPPERIEVAASGFEARLAVETPTELHLRKAPHGELYVKTPTGRRLRANTVATITKHRLSKRDVEIRTNSLGYRNREIGPKERRRVLFLGDSITFGDYVAEDETFVRLVETLSEAGPTPLETINAGVGSIGLENEIAILLESGLGTEPDVVVVDFFLNDLLPSPGVRALSVPRYLRWSVLARHAVSALAPWVHPPDRGGETIDPERLAAWAEQARAAFPPGPGDVLEDPPAFHAFVLERFDQWGNLWSEGAWNDLRLLFRELRRLADRHAFELRVVAFPVREQVEASFLADYPQRRLAELCAELGIPLLDLLPRLREAHRASDEELFYDRCHPTPHGNRVVAEAILEFLTG